MLEITQFLSLNACGNEVKDLHKCLIKLGYPVPKHERKEEIFGVGTREAVLKFQTKNDLRRIGKLDDQTKEALSRAVAAAAGILSLDADQIAKAKATLENFARAKRGAAKAPGTVSSIKELLQESGLNEAEQRTFEDLYFAHRGPAEKLWDKARKAGIPAAKVDQLRLQGKLAHDRQQRGGLGKAQHRITILANSKVCAPLCWRQLISTLYI